MIRRSCGNTPCQTYWQIFSERFNDNIAKPFKKYFSPLWENPLVELIVWAFISLFMLFWEPVINGIYYYKNKRRNVCYIKTGKYTGCQRPDD